MARAVTTTKSHNGCQSWHPLVLLFQPVVPEKSNAKLFKRTAIHWGMQAGKIHTEPSRCTCRSCDWHNLPRSSLLHIQYQNDIDNRIIFIRDYVAMPVVILRTL
jgi:hypothetical protein